MPNPAASLPTGKLGRLRLQLIGQRIGHVQVLAADPETADLPVRLAKYQVKFLCCGRVGILTHRQVVMINSRQHREDYYGRCRACAFEVREPVDLGSGKLPAVGHKEDELAALVLRRMQWRDQAERAARAARIAARRAENAAKAAAAHALAMAAPPLRALSDDEMRDLRARPPGALERVRRHHDGR